MRGINRGSFTHILAKIASITPPSSPAATTISLYLPPTLVKTSTFPSTSTTRCSIDGRPHHTAGRMDDRRRAKSQGCHGGGTLSTTARRGCRRDDEAVVLGVAAFWGVAAVGVMGSIGSVDVEAGATDDDVENPLGMEGSFVGVAAETCLAYVNVLGLLGHEDAVLSLGIAFVGVVAVAAVVVVANVESEGFPGLGAAAADAGTEGMGRGTGATRGVLE